MLYKSYSLTLNAKKSSHGIQKAIRQVSPLPPLKQNTMSGYVQSRTDMSMLMLFPLSLKRQRFMVNLQASTIAFILHECKQVFNQYLYLHFPTQSM